jgi:sigma-B regulation protein RsbU (phosphoserine phosphatase)
VVQRYRQVLIALLSSVAVYLAANAAEFAFIRALHPTEVELTWISDLILAGGFGYAIYLWLHLKAARKELADAERARIAIDTELALAAEIQRSFLPRVPAPLEGLRWAASQAPAGKVGGDFYDFVRTGDHSMLFLLGDISGKGIPAALLLASVRALFRLFSKETQRPAELVNRLSCVLYQETGGAMFMTCLVGLFDLAERSLTFTNAGHPPGLIIGSGNRLLLETGGVPAGLFESSSYQSKTVALGPGAAGVFVTDGISEAVECDGSSAFEVLAATIANVGPADPEKICAAIMRLADKGAGPAADEGGKDDQTVLCFVVDR